MAARSTQVIPILLALVVTGSLHSVALSQSEWEPYGLSGYDVGPLFQRDAYLYAGVFPSPRGQKTFAHGVWRRHEHPDSSWAQLGPEGIGVLGIWVHADDPLIVYVSVVDTQSYPQSEGNLVYRTLDGGASWEPLEPGPSARGSSSIVGAPSDPDRMLLSAYVDSHVNRVVRTSTDAGATWVSSEQASDVLVYSPVDEHTVWTNFSSGFFSGQVFRSTDDGQTWEEKFYHPSRGVGPVAISPGGRVYAVLRGGGVMHSDDDGETWIVQPLPPDGGLWDVDVSPGDASLVMTAEWPGKGSIWLSTDAGMMWTDTSAPDSLTNWDVMASHTEPGVFYVSAEGLDIANNTAGVWRYEAEPVVSTPASGPPRDPVQLTLRRNPVSRSAAFTLSLPPDAVRSALRVYDARGRLVASLDAWQPTTQGAEIVWDGRASDGTVVAPAAYFGVVDTARGELQTRFVWLE